MNWFNFLEKVWFEDDMSTKIWTKFFLDIFSRTWIIWNLSKFDNNEIVKLLNIEIQEILKKINKSNWTDLLNSYKKCLILLQHLHTYVIIGIENKILKIDNSFFVVKNIWKNPTKTNNKIINKYLGNLEKVKLQYWKIHLLLVKNKTKCEIKDIIEIQNFFKQLQQQIVYIQNNF